jgi:hypothetical protein
VRVENTDSSARTAAFSVGLLLGFPKCLTHEDRCAVPLATRTGGRRLKFPYGTLEIPN